MPETAPLCRVAALGCVARIERKRNPGAAPRFTLPYIGQRFVATRWLNVGYDRACLTIARMGYIVREPEPRRTPGSKQDALATPPSRRRISTRPLRTTKNS